MAPGTVRSPSAARNAVVEISLRMGPRNKSLVGWEDIHQQSGLYDVGMTWEQALLAKFGRCPNVQRYSVRRQDNSAPNHHLREEIRELINEFKQVRKTFIVLITENVMHGQSSALGNAGAAVGNRQRPQAPIMKNFQSVQTKPAPRVDNSQRMREASPTAASTSSTAPILLRASLKTRSNRNAPSVEPRTILKNSQAPKRSSAGPPPSTPPPQRIRFSEDTLPGDDFVRPSYRLVEDDNMSQYTTVSQDSQDDLREMGIEVKDIKPLFVRRAMEKFTNSHLLEVQHYLLQMKGTNRWSKWNRLCPAASNVIRELFDV